LNGCVCQAVSEVRLHGVHLGELEAYGVTGLRIVDASVIL
jgi:hypothetical protein